MRKTKKKRERKRGRRGFSVINLSTVKKWWVQILENSENSNITICCSKICRQLNFTKRVTCIGRSLTMLCAPAKINSSLPSQSMDTYAFGRKSITSSNSSSILKRIMVSSPVSVCLKITI